MKMIKPPRAIMQLPGFKPVTLRPLPDHTWKALRLVPGIFLGVGGTLSALSWINNRRDRIKALKEQDEQSASDQGDAVNDTEEQS